MVGEAGASVEAQVPTEDLQGELAAMAAGLSSSGTGAYGGVERVHYELAH